MKLLAIFGQRKEHYEGEYAPEVLACVTEFDYSDNPDYLDGELVKAKADSSFEAVAVITLRVDVAAIQKVLRPSATIKAEVVVE